MTDYKALADEHAEWAAVFGAVIVDALQGNYDRLGEIAKSWPIEFPDGAPVLKSAALAKYKQETGNEN
jgi:hypothetical protein